MKTYNLKETNEKLIEKLVMNPKGQYIHMILPKGEGLPIHHTNAELFMTVIKGTLSLGLNKEKALDVAANTMIHIPFNTEMNVSNNHDETLELIVVKTVPEGKDSI
jgi:quercetin dioxygenase-like cupin family protein